MFKTAVPYSGFHELVIAKPWCWARLMVDAVEGSDEKEKTGRSSLLTQPGKNRKEERVGLGLPVRADRLGDRNSGITILIPTRGKLGGAAPMAFTEQGVAMLSSVLRSRRAVQVIPAFSHLWQLPSTLYSL
jgi:hypothetical protein